PEGWAHGGSRIAIDRDAFGSGPRDDGEPETKEDSGYDDADAPGQFHIFSFAAPWIVGDIRPLPGMAPTTPLPTRGDAARVRRRGQSAPAGRLATSRREREGGAAWVSRGGDAAPTGPGASDEPGKTRCAGMR